MLLTHSERSLKFFISHVDNVFIDCLIKIYELEGEARNKYHPTCEHIQLNKNT